MHTFAPRVVGDVTCDNPSSLHTSSLLTLSGSNDSHANVRIRSMRSTGYSEKLHLRSYREECATATSQDRMVDSHVMFESYYDEK